MKTYRGIVKSDTAPSTDLVWICGKEIKVFTNGKWEILNEPPKIELPKIEVPKNTDIYNDYVKAGGTKSRIEFAKELINLFD